MKRPISKFILRRRLLTVAATTPLLLAVANGRSTQRRSLKKPLSDFRIAGDTTDTPALKRAIERGVVAYLPGGGGTASNGAYVVDGVELRPGTLIEGDGGQTIVAADPKGSGTCFIVKGAGRGSFVDNIVLRNFSISGLQQARGFSEHIHLLNFSGVRNLTIERVTFSGMQGDAIYIGAGYMDALGLHNRNVAIRSCSFNGENRSNRNAISVVSGEGIEIVDCNFVACSRPDMPGPIDFEVNSPGKDRLGDIRVEECSFSECGGTAGQISVIAASAPDNAQGDFRISRNKFESYKGSGAEILIDIQSNTAKRPNPARVLINDNRGQQGSRPMWLKSAAFVRCNGNRWEGYARPMIVGTARGETVKSAIISDVFDGEKSIPAAMGMIDLYDVGDIDLRGSQFVHCSEPSGAPIVMTDGKVNQVTLTMRSFARCSGKGKPIFSRQRSHKTMRILIDGRVLRHPAENLLIK